MTPEEEKKLQKQVKKIREGQLVIMAVLVAMSFLIILTPAMTP